MEPILLYQRPCTIEGLKKLLERFSHIKSFLSHNKNNNDNVRALILKKVVLKIHQNFIPLKFLSHINILEKFLPLKFSHHQTPISLRTSHSSYTQFTSTYPVNVQHRMGNIFTFHDHLQLH